MPLPISIGRDGNQIFVMLGDNPQEGVAGFGSTIPEALEDLAENVRREGPEELENQL